MAISLEEFFDVMGRFHNSLMIDNAPPEVLASYFVHPDPLIYIPHSGDVSTQANFELHEKLTDERHVPLSDWDVSQMCADPERARFVGGIYWEGRVIGAASDAIIKVVVGEDILLQRMTDGEVKIALYINRSHHFLPDSAPFELP